MARSPSDPIIEARRREFQRREQARARTLIGAGGLLALFLLVLLAATLGVQ